MPSLSRRPLHKAFIEKNFANRDPEEVSELGRVGGLVAQHTGSAHKLTREERSRGGKIGGKR
jgi:general stress protein YciG